MVARRGIGVIARIGRSDLDGKIRQHHHGVLYLGFTSCCDVELTFGDELLGLGCKHIYIFSSLTKLLEVKT